MMTTQSFKSLRKVPTTINVAVSDFVLTPLSCAFLVNEVMKNILYNRSQIPYPYTWLKSIVNKKRRSLEETESDSSKNFTLNRHYRIVSTAYDSVENIMTNIKTVCTQYSSNLKEIVFLIGVTPVCPKEVFTIRVSSIARGHVERNHVVQNGKKQSKVLRDIFLQTSWMRLIQSPLACSNTYLFIKLIGKEPESLLEEDMFVQSKPLVITTNVKHHVVYLNYSETGDFLCCDKLEVFNDATDTDPLKETKSSIIQETENADTEIWLQSKVLIQGFKDCFINKVSASDLW